MADGEKDAVNRKIVVVIDEDLRDLIPGYLDNRRKDVKEILAALDRGDFEAIRVLSHNIKGSGSGYGFDELTNIGKACEDASKRSQAQEVREQVARLRAYLESVEVVFQP